MKKSLKIKTTVTMALVACFSLVFGLTMLASPATTAKADAPATFEMLGASVRYETAENANDNGIRFGVQLDKTAYAALTADENAEAGILICPEDQYTGDLAVGTAKATKGVVKGEQGLENVMIGTWTENAGGYMQTWVYMTGIPEESFNRPISGRAYIDWNGDASDVSYSDTVTKAIADVALAVREDYEGSNTYETTAAQYASLDDYLLNYNVKFIDAYGNEATQSVKYGDELEVAGDPATRTGYTFTGWYEKNGESAYAATATDFNATNAKKVKYARTFKPGFNTNGTTFEKPAIGVGHARAVAKGLQGDTSVTDGVLSVRGAYYFDGAEVENGSDYLVQMTFTSNGGDIWFVLSDDQAAGYGRIEYRTGNNKFYIYNYTSGTYRGVAWNWYDSIEERGNATAAIVAGNEYTMTMVHKNGKYTVFINGVKATEFSESEELTMWGSKSDPVKHVTDIVGDGEKVYVGIGSINATTAVTDWRYSVDAETIEAFVPTEKSDNTMLAVANFKSNVTNGGGYNYDANPANSGDNPSFDVTATEAADSTSTYVGFTFSAYGDNKLYVGYNKTTSRVRVQVGNDYREYTIKTDGGYSDGYNAEGDNTFRLVYNGGAAMTFYINGQEAYLTNGFNNCICLRYGMDGDGGAAFCSGNGSVKAWHGFAGSSEAQGNERTLYIGTFGDGMTVASVPVANFASDLSNGVFTNNNGTNNNNPQFEVQATFAYNAAIDHYGFKFQQVGNGTSTVFAYDATNGYFGYYKNGNKASDWREFRITNYSKDTFTANAQNMIKVVYYGDRVLDVYINGTKIIFATDGDDGQRGGNNGSFYLGWNCVATSSAHGSQTPGDGNSAKPFAWWGTSTVDSRATLNVSAYQFTGNTDKGAEGVSDFLLTITRAYS